MFVAKPMQTSMRVNATHNRSLRTHTRAQFRQHRANRSPPHAEATQPRPMERTHE